MIGDSGLHRRRDSERFVHAAEVEKGHVQMNSGSQMFERLAETEAQSRKAAKVRPHAQVCAFYVASADSFHLRISADAYWDGRRYFRGVVPLRPFAVSRSVEFEQLGEVNVRAEVFFDGGDVTAKPVRCDLESAGDALAQILDEIICAGTFALCDQIRQDHFCFAVDCHPDVLIAPLLRNVAVQVGFLGMDKGPEFIGLHESRMDIPHARIEQASRFIPDREKQRKNRALVGIGDARDSTHAHTFEQEFYDLCRFFGLDVVASERLLARLGERGFTGRATVPLDSIASVESEPSCFLVFATDARHGLLFPREKPYNQSLGFECGLRPRLDSAPPLVQARDGAFYLRKFGNLFLCYGLSLTKSLIRKSVARSFLFANPHNASFVGKRLHYSIEAVRCIARLFKTVYKFACRYGFTLAIDSLTKHHEKGTVCRSFRLHRKRDYAALYAANAVELASFFIKSRPMRFRFRGRFRAWSDVLRFADNKLFESFELLLHDFGRSLRLKLVIPDLDFDTRVFHLSPLNQEAA